MIRPLFGSAALSVLFTSSSALADVTPQDVWRDWQDHMQSMGYTLTATEKASGDTLAVSNVRFDLTSEPDLGQITMSLEQLSLVQNDDGTVSVVMPDAMPLMFEITPTDPDEDRVRAALTVNQTGQDMRVSGTPTDLSSAYAAGLLGLTLDQMTVGDETFGPDNASLNVVLNNVEYASKSVLDDMRAYAQDGSIASMTFDMRFKDPKEPAIATINGTSTDMTFDGDGRLPLGIAQASDMAAMLRAGMTGAGTFTSGNSTMTVDIEDPENGNMSAAVASEGGRLTVETSADGMSYAGSRQGMALSVQPQQFPFLLSFGLDNAAFNLSAPVLKTDDAQDVALGLNLEGFTMSDMVWGMINPQGTLPRDPANLSLDVSGKARLLMDYFDPEAATRMAETGQVPAQLDSVNLNALIVDALGAKLTGNGAVTFEHDENGPTALKPSGAVDLKLVGGNTLIDTLVSSGLLPAQMAMGARMMMGMFAVPAEGEEDTLKSKLEFTRDGQILANGQRIK